MLPAAARVDDHHPDGAPSRITLSAPSTIDGVLCAAFIVHLHPNGRIESASVGGACVVHGWSLDDGDQVAMQDTGALQRIRFAKTRRVEGVDDVQLVTFYDAGQIEELHAASSVFDARGTLLRRQFRRGASESIDGVVCASVAMFHANGRLRSAFLGAPLVSAHGKIPVGSSVTFDENGSLILLTLGAAAKIAGKRYDAGTGLALDGASPRVVPTWTFHTGA